MTENFIHFTNSLNAIYCSIWYIEHNRMISIAWKGTAPDESVMMVKESLLEMIKEKDCVVILNDVQQFFSAPAELLRHLGTVDWDMEVSRLGVKYLVHVLKPDTELPEEETDPSHSLTIKYFHHKIDAIEWIKKNAVL